MEDGFLPPQGPFGLFELGVGDNVMPVPLRSLAGGFCWGGGIVVIPVVLKDVAVV